MRVGAREAVALAAAIALHVIVAAGLASARGHRPSLPKARVKFAVKTVPAPELPPPPPPPPPPPQPAVPPPPQKHVATAQPHATHQVPAPSTPDTPAPQRIYIMPGDGQMAVNPGSPDGSATGSPDGKAGGHVAGGGPVGPPPSGHGDKTVSLASVASMPVPIGDYDTSTDYPDEARKLGIEGQVTLRILVGVDGNVAQVKLVKRLGHGLDERSLALAPKLRFHPARDDSGQPVATWIPWTFTYKLPQ